MYARVCVYIYMYIYRSALLRILLFEHRHFVEAKHTLCELLESRAFRFDTPTILDEQGALLKQFVSKPFYEGIDQPYKASQCLIQRLHLSLEGPWSLSPRFKAQFSVCLSCVMLLTVIPIAAFWCLQVCLRFSLYSDVRPCLALDFICSLM